VGEEPEVELASSRRYPHDCPVDAVSTVRQERSESSLWRMRRAKRCGIICSEEPPRLVNTGSPDSDVAATSPLSWTQCFLTADPVWFSTSTPKARSTYSRPRGSSPPCSGGRSTSPSWRAPRTGCGWRQSGSWGSSFAPRLPRYEILFRISSAPTGGDL
jgi:hypothetical protein